MKYGYLLFTVGLFTVSFVVLPLSAKAASFLYNFNQDGVLKEAGSMLESPSPYWWVNSGAYLKMFSGRGHTNEGELPDLDPWRVIYSLNNPVDTDNGYHPQNIFRMPTKAMWQNVREEAYFVISKDNLSTSPNRNSSNGLLLFNRYQNGQTLYYAGVRVDGAAVIKKKLNGTYYTMAYVPGIYPGTYNHDTNPNLLPKNKWIGLRTETINQADGSVRVKLFLDKGWSGVWNLVAEVVDNGQYGGAPIRNSGYGGIRTDFMDVSFENFRLTDL